MRLPTVLSLIALILVSTGFPVTSTRQTGAIPSVEFCPLVSSPESYDGKELRVHGVYTVSGTGASTFFSSACSATKRLWVELDPEFRSCSTRKSVRQLEQMWRKSGVRRARPHSSVIKISYKSAEVEFLGTFLNSNPFTPAEGSTPVGPFGPILSDRQRADVVFRVRCIEKLKPLSRTPP